MFLCPDDPFQSTEANTAPNSYRCSSGTGRIRLIDGFHGSPNVTVLPVYNGAFTYSRHRNLLGRPISGFRDGLSHTLAFSEKPIGSGSAPPSPFRDWYGNIIPGVPGMADQRVAFCSSPEILQNLSLQRNAGSTWMLPGAIYTAFFVGASPNSVVPDCGNSNHGGLGLFTARSYHAQGVNAALADGAVRQFSTGIASKAWESLGTCSGGELLPE